ncbi:PREDICTED: uncharacterized protein LOC104805540 [Tarenaya hassleriana]|uniref:uncharacterized protein LOC104805540 n=1 Tax=Tarenaya hassleriana TaxID=28532 RepID=UPI00053C0B67|nr:PREDICTED: uncharacterized protein LOC104805540 [Tarenaya hassleriana]
MEKEECRSNESGWTMYISSPMEEDDEEVVDENYYDEGHYVYRECRKGHKEDENNKDSDDSMASDASSGPSYQHYNQKRNSETHPKINRGRRREGFVSRSGKGDSVGKCYDEDDSYGRNDNSSNYKGKKKEKKNGENNKTRHRMK